MESRMYRRRHIPSFRKLNTRKPKRPMENIYRVLFYCKEREPPWLQTNFHTQRQKQPSIMRELNSVLKVLHGTISKRNCLRRKKSGSQISGQSEVIEGNAAARTREIGSTRNSIKNFPNRKH